MSAAHKFESAGRNRNTGGVYGIWELLIERFSDLRKGLETPSKWNSVEAFSPPFVGRKSSEKKF